MIGNDSELAVVGEAENYMFRADMPTSNQCRVFKYFQCQRDVHCGQKERFCCIQKRALALLADDSNKGQHAPWTTSTVDFIRSKRGQVTAYDDG